LVRLEAAVRARLGDAGIEHRTEIVKGRTTPWVLAVWTDDGLIDDLMGVPGRDLIGIVPRYQEDVSVELATEYVAMCHGLLAEDEWWGMFEVERARAEAQRRAERRARLRRWLGRTG
jgi:hypothetical protein